MDFQKKKRQPAHLYFSAKKTIHDKQVDMHWQPLNFLALLGTQLCEKLEMGSKYKFDLTIDFSEMYILKKLHKSESISMLLSNACANNIRGCTD